MLSLLAVILLLAASTTFDESYRAGLRALQQNHLEEARTSLEKAAGIDAAHSGVWLALAQTYWKSAEKSKALDAANRANGLAKGDVRILPLLAGFYAETGQALKACGVREDFANAVPNDREALPRAVECFLQAEAPDRALLAGTHKSGWENRADIRDLLGKAYTALHELDAAATEFQASVRLNPNDESSIFDLANCMLQQQKFEAAIRVLEQGTRTSDKSAQLELALGVAYYGLRRFPEAATAFQRTIALSPELEQPYLFLGKMLDQIPSSIPQLIVLFAAFEKAQPQNYAGYLLHAKALIAQTATTDSAEELLRKACSLNGRIAESHFTLGVLLERQQRFAEAAREFENSVTIDPADAATHYHLARVYDRLGKHEEAAAERNRHRQLLDATEATAAR